MKAIVRTKHSFGTLLALPVALLVLACATSRAAVTISSSLTAPTQNGADQFYLPGNVDDVNNIDGAGITASGQNDESTYVAGDRSSKGMTFTTGANALGYTLSSISVQNVLWNNFLDNGTFHQIDNNATFEFQFGTMSGTTKSILFDTDTATYTSPSSPFGGDNGTGLFFTFDLSGESIPTLLANTLYYFELTTQTGTAFFELNGTSADGYAGGQAYRGNPNPENGQLNTAVNFLTGDFAFHADLSPVPEPGTYAMLLGGLGMLIGFRRRKNHA